MDDWRARHVNVLNLIVDMRQKTSVLLRRKFTQLSFLHQLCSGNEAAMEEVRAGKV